MEMDTVRPQLSALANPATAPPEVEYVIDFFRSRAQDIHLRDSGSLSAPPIGDERRGTMGRKSTNGLR